MNSVNLMGRMTRDAELRYTANDKAVISCSIAVNKGREGADFINCVAWEKTATFIEQYFHKGDMIALSGRLQSRTYTDKNDQKRTVIEVVADRAYFTGSKKDSESGPVKFIEITEDDGDLPF